VREREQRPLDIGLETIAVGPRRVGRLDAIEQAQRVAQVTVGGERAGTRQPQV
jgi:hypothetical protein